MNKKEFFNILKKEFELDFRSDKYLQNGYGLYPTMHYERAESIVKRANELLFEEFGDKRFWNIHNDLQELETTILKEYLEHIYAIYSRKEL